MLHLRGGRVPAGAGIKDALAASQDADEEYLVRRLGRTALGARWDHVVGPPAMTRARSATWTSLHSTCRSRVTQATLASWLTQLAERIRPQASPGSKHGSAGQAPRRTDWTSCSMDLRGPCAQALARAGAAAWDEISGRCDRGRAQGPARCQPAEYPHRVEHWAAEAVDRARILPDRHPRTDLLASRICGTTRQGRTPVPASAGGRATRIRLVGTSHSRLQRAAPPQPAE